MIRAQDPLVVFLVETWLDKARLEDIRIKLNFGGMIEFCRETRGGGIVIFWKKEIDFSLGTLSDLQVIQNILSLYEKASGQKLNWETTTIFFSKAVSEDIKTQISNYLEVPEVKEYEKYLGLPAVVGRKKKESLNFIKERIWSKLQGWKEKLLSQADREILLKAVVQAIPTFAMSCFKLPGGLCDEIEALIRKFFWGQKGGGGGRKEKFIGKNGRLYVSLNLKVGWNSKTWENLTMQCWQNKFGDY